MADRIDKKNPVSKWFGNITIAKKLYFTVGIMALLIIIELGVLMFSIHTLSSVRAYVGGEGLWSKAQKDAMYQLLRYSRSYEEADYQKFLAFMKVSEGDHKTLAELSKKQPNLENATNGFIEGRNHPDDVDGMIKLFRRFNKISYINKAIHIWFEADQMVAKFIPIGEKLHQEINSSSPSQDKINQILFEIDPINAKLTVLEDDFSYTLGEGSRWLENLILKLLFAVALSVELTGLLIAIIVSRGIQKGLNEILISAKAIAKGDFSKKAVAFSNDEIGILANNFNKMSEELRVSILEMEQAQQKFKGLLESAPDAIVIAGSEGVVLMVNKQCENVFGYKKEELIGKRIESLFAPHFFEKETSYKNIFYSESGERPNGHGMELPGLRKNGEEFPVEISLSPLQTEEGLLLSVAMRDISERKYIKELEGKNKELEQFAYISSHDLKEPLSTIIGLVSMLEQDNNDKLDEEGKKQLRFIKESSNRMGSLINDLLEYSRIGHTSQPETIDCANVVEAVIADMKASINERKAKIIVGELPTIKGYSVEVRLLFQNLISNAIKFQKKDESSIVKVFAEETEKNFLFTIEDNGIGIDKKNQEKIFIIFKRLNSSQEYDGSGIGLAHCKKIVELHGGKLWVDSDLGMGCKFHFTFLKS